MPEPPDREPDRVLLAEHVADVLVSSDSVPVWERVPVGLQLGLGEVVPVGLSEALFKDDCVIEGERESENEEVRVCAGVVLCVGEWLTVAVPVKDVKDGVQEPGEGVLLKVTPALAEAEPVAVLVWLADRVKAGLRVLVGVTVDHVTDTVRSEPVRLALGVGERLDDHDREAWSEGENDGVLVREADSVGPGVAVSEAVADIELDAVPEKLTDPVGEADLGVRVV